MNSFYLQGTKGTNHLIKRGLFSDYEEIFFNNSNTWVEDSFTLIFKSLKNI